MALSLNFAGMKKVYENHLYTIYSKDTFYIVRSKEGNDSYFRTLTEAKYSIGVSFRDTSLQVSL